MTRGPLTVGDLRAELVGWPDDARLVVHVPDRSDPNAAHVLPVVAVGYGPGLEAGSDPVLATALPLTVAWHDDDDTGVQDARTDD